MGEERLMETPIRRVRNKPKHPPYTWFGDKQEPASLKRARNSLREHLKFVGVIGLIIIESSGRFGNQLFQYAGVVCFSKRRETILLVGFHQLASYFGDAVGGRIRRLSLRAFHLLCRLPRKIMGLPVLGEVLLGGRGQSLFRKRGIFPIYIWRAGYCQDEALIAGNAVLELYESRQLLKTRPHDDVSQEQKTPQCFVHVRRGDYLKAPPESSPVIPLSWFRDQIAEIRGALGAVEFVFFSEDYHWLEKHFQNDSDFLFFRGSDAESFAAMAGCQAGILSASTFSWWAAYLAVNTGATGPFVAPRYWMGWKNKTWYPANIESQFLSYALVGDRNPREE
jgi:hypothetical protein